MIRRGYVDVGDGQIHYRVRAGRGTPVVCFHQTASSGAMYEAVMRAWPGAHPVYALDTPGFGGSYDPEGQPTMAQYADRLAEAIQALGLGAVHLFGHHTGASVAVEIAVRYPTLARSLAMIGPVTITAEEAQFFKTLYPKDFVLKADGSHVKKMWEYVAEIGGASSLALHHREFVDTARAWQGHLKVYSVIWDQDFTGHFRQVKCPMAILCSQGDILWPMYERAKSLRPDATAIELEGTNFQPDEAPANVAQAVHGFVSQHDRGA
jgi:pimeloyl-ACP methyl ester carboxylesterase